MNSSVPVNGMFCTNEMIRIWPVRWARCKNAPCSKRNDSIRDTSLILHHIKQTILIKAAVYCTINNLHYNVCTLRVSLPLLQFILLKGPEERSDKLHRALVSVQYFCIINTAWLHFYLSFPQPSASACSVWTELGRRPSSRCWQAISEHPAAGCGSRITLGMEMWFQGKAREQISLEIFYKAGWQRKKKVKVWNKTKHPRQSKNEKGRELNPLKIAYLLP